LESIEAMFSTSSPFFQKMEAAYREAGNGDVLGHRRLSLANPAENARRWAMPDSNSDSLMNDSDKVEQV
jgi:hypothetical protein